MIKKITKAPNAFPVLTQKQAQELMLEGAMILVIATKTVYNSSEYVLFRCEHFNDAFRGRQYASTRFAYPLDDPNKLPPKGDTELQGWWGHFHLPTNCSSYTLTIEMHTRYVVVYPKEATNGHPMEILRIK